MTESMYVQVLPPGEREQLTCEDCGGTEFHLFTESRDGEIDFFHSLCTGCGKRGALTTKVEVTQTREFAQFANIPPGPTSGYTIIGGSDEEPPE